MENSSKYIIYKYLDEETRIFGLPLDEFIPVALFIAFGFLVKLLMLGILFAVSVLLILKRLKRYRGKRALLSILYWHGSVSVGKSIFPSFPKSTDRNFI